MNLFAAAFKPGTKVGARRWPYYGSHPDIWGKPWAGKVLAANDPKAWANSLAFPGRIPKKAEVDAHLAALAARGITVEDKVPVEWEFGKTYWERPENVRPYAEDLEAWNQERWSALQEAA